MPIPFNQVPSNLRIPFVAVEFDPSQANQGPALLAYSALIIGQKLSTGTWAADTVNRATSVADVIAGAGRGSIAHRQAIGWFASNQSTALSVGVLADNGAGVAATGTILFTGAATAAGTNTAAAINANPDLPITASVSSSTVTMLFRHKGLVGNSYDTRTNYNAGEVLPAGVA